MIQNLNLYSIALLNLSKFIHPNWLLYAPKSFDLNGEKIGFDSKFVLIETSIIE